jgi:hypothetical protein
VRACAGQCKKPSTTDFTPQAIVHPVFGWVFTLHDTINCPDRVKWHMNALQAAARKLREQRDGR